MTIQEVSYLLRYAFVFLISIAVWLLVRLSIGELRWDMRNRILPVPGYSLMMQKSPAGPGSPATDSAGGQLRVMQLWHTTMLGRSRSCDVRLTEPGTAKRHAVVYLYDGKWYIRPAGSRQEVLLNEKRIHAPSILKNLDQITISSQVLAFLNRNQDADLVDLQHMNAQKTPVFPKERSIGKIRGAWLALNLFMLCGIYVLVFTPPSGMLELQTLLGGFCLGFLFLMNLHFWLLPLLFKQADKVLLLCLMLLTSLGILFQARLSMEGMDQEAIGAAAAAMIGSMIADMRPQAISLIMGMMLLPMMAFLVARTRIPESIGILCALATPVLLLVTLFLGRGSESHGAALWIHVGSFSLQLTEFTKITYLFVLAWFFKNRPTRSQQVLFAVWAAFVLFLIMLLPDLGSALILLPTTLLVFVVMTSEYGTTLAILGSGTGLAVAAYALFPHVQRRLAGWTSLWTEVNDGNRQIVYSLQAITRGGLFGRGLSNGSPDGIPLASSDMVFSIVCEELGLITGLCIILAFIVLWLRAARITLIGQDGFTSGLALGIGTLFFMEAAVVIAGVTGLIPLTGATLPLIARGGSSILAKLLMFGILIGLSARRTKVDGMP